jgi:uncharacterized protein YkwD
MFIMFVAAAVTAAAAPARPDLDRVETLVVEGTNRFRAAEGLGTVSPNARLEQAARSFAQYLADGGTFAHESGGTTPEVRVRAQGYEFCVVAENLARYYNSAGFATADLAQRLVQGWKDSPGHRKNMLEPDALETAVAVVHRTHNGYEDFYAVQLFARSAATRTKFRVYNESGGAVKYRLDEREYALQNRYIREHTVCGDRTLVFDRGEFHPENGDRFTLTAGAVKRGRGGSE